MTSGAQTRPTFQINFVGAASRWRNNRQVPSFHIPRACPSQFEPERSRKEGARIRDTREPRLRFLPCRFVRESRHDRRTVRSADTGEYKSPRRILRALFPPARLSHVHHDSAINFDLRDRTYLVTFVYLATRDPGRGALSTDG